MKPIPADILIIDDNVNNLKLITRFLEDQGYDTMTAKEGRDGLAKAGRGHPDLILLDVMMPGMDGMTVCRRLKKNPDTADIPVIFLTAKGAAEDIVSGFKLGAVDYITKPFQPDELCARVKTHLLLRKTIARLEKALDEIQVLEGILPICSYCKKIRDDNGHWHHLESYISRKSEVSFSHGICKECARIHHPELDLFSE